MLTGPEIQQQIADGAIVIDPFVPAHVNPNSVDLRLGTKLLCYELKPECRMTERSWAMNDKEIRNAIDPEHYHWSGVLDMARDVPVRELVVPVYPRGLVLIPGRLYLGVTREYTETHRHVPGIEGRSSIGRLGIDVHATAGFGDVGFKGTWTLEISVRHPVRVYADVRICQIYYSPVTGEIAPYTSQKYQGQRDPRPSQLWREFQPKE
jgi:dCTP deaminase